MLEAAELVPEIIAEHCKLSVAWDSDHPERTETWIRSILELMRILVEHAEAIVDGDQDPAEAKQNLRRFLGGTPMVEQ